MAYVSVYACLDTYTVEVWVDRVFVVHRYVCVCVFVRLFFCVIVCVGVCVCLTLCLYSLVQAQVLCALCSLRRAVLSVVVVAALLRAAGYNA